LTSYNVILASSFKRSVKRLKRFPCVKDDVQVAIEALLERPRIGVVIPGGHGTRKLRVRNSDLTKGKSGGYRLIYYVEDRPTPTIYLLLLYSKSARNDVTCRELEQLMYELSSEMR